MRAWLAVVLVATLLPHFLPAQQVDTAAVLAAIARAEHSTVQQMDSIDASLCAQGRQQACRPPINRRWIWYVDSGTVAGRLAATLASIDTFEVRVVSHSRPLCPWTTSAPGAGEIVSVMMSARNDSVVHLTVWNECVNPPGERLPVIQVRTNWLVLRMGTIWKARRLRTQST